MTPTTCADVRRTCFASLVLATGTLASPVVFPEEPETQSGVTVRSDRPEKKVLERSARGVPTVGYELQYRVSYADLDLATSSGASTLKQRVHDAAISLCGDLDRLEMTVTDRSCARRVENQALVDVNRAIASAEARVRTASR